MGSDAPLSLAAVRRRYPRLHAAFALLSDREREYLGDAGDDSCNTSLEAETGLLAQIACTDFAAPLDDPPADCPMRIDSDANKFAVFVGKCLEAAESGGAEEDAHMQLQLWRGALEDALAMPTAAAKFEHLLGWTAAGAHHGLHPMLGDGDLDANMALLNRASEEWRVSRPPRDQARGHGGHAAVRPLRYWVLRRFGVGFARWRRTSCPAIRAVGAISASRCAGASVVVAYKPRYRADCRPQIS